MITKLINITGTHWEIPVSQWDEHISGTALYIGRVPLMCSGPVPPLDHLSHCPSDLHRYFPA